MTEQSTNAREERLGAAVRRALAARERAPGACPDAEQLAALVDDGVGSEERARLTAHLATCVTCRDVVAALVRDEAEPVAALVRDDAAPTPAPRGGNAGAWPPWLERWVVPLGAVAAAAIVWVTVDPSSEPRGPRSTDAPGDTVVATGIPTPPAPSQERERDVPSGARFAAPSATADATSAGPAAAPVGLSTQAVGNATTWSPVEDERQAASVVVAERAQAAEPALDAMTPRAPEAREGRADEPAPPGRRAETPAAAAAVGSGALADRAETARKSDSGFDFSTTGGVRWRGGGSRVEFSDDDGATWRPLALPPGAVVTTGVVSDQGTCWLVGRSGLVLRVVGERVERTAQATTDDLVGVGARGALEASVLTASGLTLTTTDGGRTWTLRQ
jgi:hypothetical protein